MLNDIIFGLICMFLSKFFLPALKEAPAEASIASHVYLLRAGYIRQLVSGVYSWLPLGLMVLNNIRKVIDEEMRSIGCLEVLMPVVQPASLWHESGRYDDYGKEMLRFSDRHNRELLFGPTHEEAVTDVFRNNVHSYKSLPMHLYHIQWKFRDEVRPRFGLMRGREFLMKDSYSFDIDYESALFTYKQTFGAYMRIFRRLGLRAVALRADSGAIGGNLSHEFHIVANSGESELFFDRQVLGATEGQYDDFDYMTSFYAMADDMHKPESCNVEPDSLMKSRGIEVGHIFYFGCKYSEAMNAKILNNEGKSVAPHMGSYGIGVSRLVAAIVEASHDEKGIVWPENIAPFKVGLVNLKSENQDCVEIANRIYKQLNVSSISVLYDDTKDSAGVKFARMQLIGLPWQVAVGTRTLKDGTVEIKNRRTGDVIEVSVDNILQSLYDAGLSRK